MNDTPPQELIERAWNGLATAQQIHTARVWQIHELYAIFELGVHLGWSEAKESIKT